LSECLDSICITFACSSLLSHIEVIVVDQSEIKSPDITVLFKQLNLTVVYSTIKNASNARNIGAKLSSGKYLWFLDDDAKIDFFDINIFKSNLDVCFLSWTQKPHVFKKIHRWNKLNLLRRSGAPFFIVRRELYKCVEGFDYNLGPGALIRGGEDLDLLLRLNRISNINNFTIFGELTHPLENTDNKKRADYYYARGFVLALNKEYLLFAINFIYDVFQIGRYGFIRPLQLIKGFISQKIS